MQILLLCDLHGLAVNNTFPIGIFVPMLRVPCSAHAVCRGKDSGRRSGRSDDVKGANLWYAIINQVLVWRRCALPGVWRL